MHLKLSRSRSRRRHPVLFLAYSAWAPILGGVWIVSLAHSAWADPEPATIQGVPQQVVPQVAEVGLGDFTLSTGTTSILGGSGSGSSGGSGGTGGGSSTNSDALDTMMGTSWGGAAAQNAQALGVNSTALAATCLMESGCQNISGSGSAQGTFQMMPSTYNAMMTAALSQDPNLGSNIVSGSAGMTDPATESIAAAEYLRQGAQYLQNNGVSQPTVLDVRGYYNFGPQGGAALANASDGDSIASTLSMYTPSQLAQNGITSGETVGQWKTSVSSKLGNSASAPVLT